MNRKMIFGTWNAQGMNNKIIEILTEIKKQRVNIAVITETKKKGKGSEKCGEYLHFWSGVDKDQHAKSGVSILIEKSQKRYIKEYTYVSERIITVTTILYGIETIIIGVYAPTDDATQQVKERFYEQLSHVVNRVKSHQEIIVAGDLNARVGSRKNDEVVGEYGEDVVNGSGEMLIEFCKQYELKILNSFYSHKDIHKYTWERPSLNQKSIIDFFITRQRSGLRCHDCRVKRGANCGSDHYLLTSNIVWPYATRGSQKRNDREESESITKKYKLHLLKQQSIKELYHRRLEEKLMKCEMKDNVEEEYENLKECLKSTAFEVLGIEQPRKTKQTPQWLTEEINDMIEVKNRAYDVWLADKTPQNRNNYQTRNRELRREIKKQKNEMWEQQCIRVENLIGGAQTTEVWRCITNLKKNQNNKIPDNTISIENWKNHYVQLLTESRSQYKYERQVSVDDELTPNLQITNENTRSALYGMKSGRAPGPGNIPVELLKAGGPILIERITKLISNCCQQIKIPSEWKTAHLVSIFKKGNRKDPNCYRGLSVICTFSRLFGKVIHEQIRIDIGHEIGEDQSGFRSGRSCTDNLFILQQLIEKKIAVGEEVHMAFVDLEKAYDNVPRMKLWEALQNLKINKHLLLIIQESYNDNKGQIKIGNQVSSSFMVTKGLRQGCSMSPLLFNLYVEAALRQWKRNVGGMGVPIGEDTLFSLSFADDQVILAQDAYDLEFMMRRLYNEYEKWGLQVSLSKTEYLVANSEANFQVLINDQTMIKQVDRFKYLGAYINKNGLGECEIRQRIYQSRKIIGCLNSLWWDRNISQKNKKRVGRVMVESVLTYGSEVWTVGAELRRRLIAVEMDYLRRSARISRLERRTNVEVRDIMDARETVIDRIERRGLKWFGHILRMPEGRWPKRIFRWRPPGRRKRGRPRRSWNEGIRNAMEARDLEEEDAMDRTAWRWGTGMQR